MALDIRDFLKDAKQSTKHLLIISSLSQENGSDSYSHSLGINTAYVTISHP